jgi:hypothetical protein
VKSREAQLRLEGMTGTRAGQAAMASVSTVKRKKQKANKSKGRARYAFFLSPASVLNKGKRPSQT